MTARTATVLIPLLAAAAAVLLAACGGDDEQPPQPAGLTDPSTVPTATPWDEAPQPIILDPKALTPSPGQENGEQPPEGEEEEDGTDGESEPVDVTPVTPFQVTSEDATNLRSGPSTDASVLGTLEAQDEATVTGQASGEAVSEGNDVWYQLEDGSFVYSGAVQEVEPPGEEE